LAQPEETRIGEKEDLVAVEMKDHHLNVDPYLIIEMMTEEEAEVHMVQETMIEVVGTVV